MLSSIFNQLNTSQQLLLPKQADRLPKALEVFTLTLTGARDELSVRRFEQAAGAVFLGCMMGVHLCENTLTEKGSDAASLIETAMDENKAEAVRAAEATALSAINYEDFSRQGLAMLSSEDCEAVEGWLSGMVAGLQATEVLPEEMRQYAITALGFTLFAVVTTLAAQEDPDIDWDNLVERCREQGGN